MIAVAPEDFLGNVPCAKNGSGLKRYVATLFDANRIANSGGGVGGESSDDQAPSAGGEAPAEFQLPSSVPSPCLTGVGFGYVAFGRYYRVEIDGYDRDDITPRASGSRQMTSLAEPVTLLTPRWRASCEPTLSLESTIVRPASCTPFAPEDAGAGSGLRVDLAGLLGKLACGTKPGEVDHFVVNVEAGKTLVEPKTIACSADAAATYDGIPARQNVSVYVTAVSAEATTAFAGATCNVLTVPDATVDASCALLNSVGTVRVDLPASLGLLSLRCNASDLDRVDVDVLSDKFEQSFPPPDCLQPFDHGFPAGQAALVTVTALGSQDSETNVELGSVKCHADVAPGKLVVAQCELDPGE
jgi:hypothetical protein